MRKIIFLQALLMIAEAHLLAQPALPYNSSTVRGSTIITNYIDPNAGPNTGPGLSISPLDARLNAPLGSSWSTQSTPPAPNVSAIYGTTGIDATPVTTYGLPSSPYNTSTLQRVGTRAGAIPTNAVGGLPGTNFAPGGLAGTNYDAYGLPLPARKEPLLPVTGGPEPFAGYLAEPTYLYPGLVRQSQGQWVGSDYLFNMSTSIGVVVEIVTPTDLPYVINSDEIKNIVSEVFANGGINPYAESFLEQPPLPFFHMIILLAKLEDGYVFSISGRFFEGVKIARLNFKTPGTSQAITWEKQELITTSSNRLAEMLSSSARDIANLFIQRINYFKYQRLEQDEMLKMRCGPAPTVKCPRRLKYMGSRPAW